MNKNNMIKWLENLYEEIGSSEEYSGLWNYEQALNQIIETLKEEINE